APRLGRYGRGLLPVRRGALEKPPDVRMAVLAPYLAVCDSAALLSAVPAGRRAARPATRAGPPHVVGAAGRRRRALHHRRPSPERAQEPHGRATRLAAARGSRALVPPRGSSPRVDGPGPDPPRRGCRTAGGRGAQARGRPAPKALPAREGPPP